MVWLRDTIRWVATGIGLLAWLGVTPAQTQAPVTFYVSPAGDDDNPGTEAAPFRSIERAQAAVRPLTADMTGDITVLLRGGTYELARPLRFDHRDSGMNGFHVVYKSFPGERAALSGGRRVTGWAPAHDGLFQASVGAARFRQLYVNGVRATRARWPNVPEFFRLLRWDEPAQEIVVPRGLVGSWSHLSAVELVILKQWRQENLRMDSVREQEEGLFIRLRQPDQEKAFRGHLFLRRTGQSLFFENALEFLDIPGEWYLRAATQEVFYRPRESEDLLSSIVMVPHLERLLDVVGTAGDPVHHLVFMGLAFEYAGWDLPSHEGFVPIQADAIFVGTFPSTGRVGGAVSVAHTHHVRFERNTFRHLGGTGLVLETGVHDIAIVGNRFLDLSGSGIVIDSLLEGRPLDPRRVCRDIFVANNLIADIGVEYRSSVGIFAGYVSRTSIEHNEVSDVPYTGISVGWGWTDEETLLGHNRITRNRVARAMTAMADGAGIYTLSKQPGTVIDENHVHGLARSPWAGDAPIAAIYLDEGSSEIMVSNNVVESVPLGLFFHRASGNTVVNTEGSYEERNQSDNNVFRREPGFSPDAVRSRAGLEPAYADLRSEHE